MKDETKWIWELHFSISVYADAGFDGLNLQLKKHVAVVLHKVFGAFSLLL